jgi:hypothetical protein
MEDPMVRLKQAALVLSLSLALAGTTSLSAWADDHHDHGTGGGPSHSTGPVHPGPAVHPGPVHPGGPAGHPGSAFRTGPGGVHTAVRGTGFHDFRGHDFAHFTAAERSAWSHGGWHHEMHNGRFGWWWAVGGLWYFYAAPIYPYPEVIADVVYEAPTPDEDMTPDDAVAGAQPGYWYYCPSSGAYYPYVQSCSVAWTAVAPTPPGVN